MITGIYGLLNNITGKWYVGQSIDVELRHKCHFIYLRRGKHHNAFLQHAFNKYGESSFSFSILEVCLKEDLDMREQFWIAKFCSFDTEREYNLNIGGGVGCFGIKRYAKEKERSEEIKINGGIVVDSFSKFASILGRRGVGKSKVRNVDYAELQRKSAESRRRNKLFGKPEKPAKKDVAIETPCISANNELDVKKVSSMWSMMGSSGTGKCKARTPEQCRLAQEFSVASRHANDSTRERQEDQKYVGLLF